MATRYDDANKAPFGVNGALFNQTVVLYALTYSLVEPALVADDAVAPLAIE